MSYPDKPIRFIVPYAEGGPGDVLARLIGGHLALRWHQPVQVVNRPGKGGMVGAKEGLDAPADGYTLILAASPHLINPSLYQSLPYDTVKDFRAVTLMISMPNILVVNSALPVSSVSELIGVAKSKP